MGGIFGVVSEGNCAKTLFYGTDYHSHLGTENAGLAVYGYDGFSHAIHSISQAQFNAWGNHVQWGTPAGVFKVLDRHEATLKAILAKVDKLEEQPQ